MSGSLILADISPNPTLTVSYDHKKGTRVDKPESLWGHVIGTVFTNLHNILPSIKLRQSQGPHRFSGLSSQEPLLVSYLTNKVGFGIISANIWLPDTVMY